VGDHSEKKDRKKEVGIKNIIFSGSGRSLGAKGSKENLKKECADKGTASEKMSAAPK